MQFFGKRQTSSALLLRRTNLPSRSISSTVMRPLAEACWLIRVFVRVAPTVLEVSLSLSLRRRFLLPEELRLLEAAVPECRRRLVWLCPGAEVEVRVTVTFVGGGLGDRRNLIRKKKTKWWGKHPVISELIQNWAESSAIAAHSILLHL